jgi:hypothetical protein
MQLPRTGSHQLLQVMIIYQHALLPIMAEDNGKEPYPDDVDATSGWPEDDAELPYDEDCNLEEQKEPYPVNLSDDGDTQ